MNHYANLKVAVYASDAAHLIVMIDKAISDAEATAERLSDALVQLGRGRESMLVKCDWIEFVLDSIESELDDYFPQLKREWKRAEKHLQRANEVAHELRVAGHRKGGRIFDEYDFDNQEAIAELMNELEHSLGPLKALKGDVHLER